LFLLVALCYLNTTLATEPRRQAIVLMIGADYINISKNKQDLFAAETEYLKDALVSNASSVYDITVKMLLSKQATRKNCLEAFEWVKHTAKPNDLVIVYIGSHGNYTEEKGFCFYPADKKVIYGSEVKEAFAGLSSDLFLIMDTCHSGAFVGDWGEGKKNETILTACDQEEVAYVWGLTVLLEESFTNADINGDNVVTINEIVSYIQAHPKDNRHPMSIMSSHDHDLVTLGD
jgi:hypothetical protein